MWNTIDEEIEHRRVLLRLAANGNVEARKELEQEYHAQVYSAGQVAAYVPKHRQPSLSPAVQRTLDHLMDRELGAA